MTFPDITHLQFAVLDIIGGSERKGRDIRAALEKASFKKSLAAFYQLTSRMEDAGLITGENRQRKVGGQSVPERWFRVTGLGQRAFQRTLEFYRHRDLNRAGAGGLAGE